MKDPAQLSRQDWEDACVVAPSDPADLVLTRRDFIRRACAVFEADFTPPLGYVHVERDDSLDWFDGDDQAAANVSDDWRWFCPETKMLSPACGAHDSPVVADMREPYKGPPVEDDYWTHNPELVAWFAERDARFDDDPPIGVRVVVPVADAIAAGLLVPDETCSTCGATAGEPHHIECPSQGASVLCIPGERDELGTDSWFATLGERSWLVGHGPEARPYAQRMARILNELRAAGRLL